MSMTPASSKYFDKVASQWDTIRQGYFTEVVRTAAIQKAYLRPEMVVADVGAGTGFMSAGLAPVVKKVYVLDGSSAMLAVARQNLIEYDNLAFQEAEGSSLPLPDESLDAVFANMYLHHIPDPLPAIRELTRILKPGGRLVITDMDAHPYTWLKDEMADAWQGFERSQMRAWFQEAGLVNVIVDCTGQSCCAESQNAALTDEAQRQADISVFVAVGTRRVSGVREAVRADYGVAAEGKSGCCGDSPIEQRVTAADSCCSGSSSSIIALEDINLGKGYTLPEQAQVPAEAAEIALGCGNPTALAALKPGEVVIDIGSGGGIDAFLAARQVGPAGRVIGVDMTPQMLARARRAAQKAGVENVEFRQGYAEALPVEDGTGDVVISNCVINLTEDKGKVFGEIYRVLKEGGRLEVSDVVTSGSFPVDLMKDPEAWPGCVFGALPEQEYLDLIAQAGFNEVRVRSRVSSGETDGVKIYSIIVSAIKNL
jgi:ubiquinone/menaquinone biosynthesis C-methylase UbiE